MQIAIILSPVYMTICYSHYVSVLGSISECVAVCKTTKNHGQNIMFRTVAIVHTHTPTCNSHHAGYKIKITGPHCKGDSVSSPNQSALPFAFRGNGEILLATPFTYSFSRRLQINPRKLCASKI